MGETATANGNGRLIREGARRDAKKGNGERKQLLIHGGTGERQTATADGNGRLIREGTRRGAKKGNGERQRLIDLRRGTEEGRGRARGPCWRL